MVEEVDLAFRNAILIEERVPAVWALSQEAFSQPPSAGRRRIGSGPRDRSSAFCEARVWWFIIICFSRAMTVTK